jgi:hypothetical protein
MVKPFAAGVNHPEPHQLPYSQAFGAFPNQLSVPVANGTPSAGNNDPNPMSGTVRSTWSG